VEVVHVALEVRDVLAAGVVVLVVVVEEDALVAAGEAHEAGEGGDGGGGIVRGILDVGLHVRLLRGPLGGLEVVGHVLAAVVARVLHQHDDGGVLVHEHVVAEGAAGDDVASDREESARELHVAVELRPLGALDNLLRDPVAGVRLAACVACMRREDTQVKDEREWARVHSRHATTHLGRRPCACRPCRVPSWADRCRCRCPSCC